ncbi:putative RNA-directed DNA polymerase from transposon BS [Exaiptasia diaphana]|nr:putative RNA-directed DNA polymerase from transposon BS [Exaiptasia diaphana]
MFTIWVENCPSSGSIFLSEKLAKSLENSSIKIYAADTDVSLNPGPTSFNSCALDAETTIPETRSTSKQGSPLFDIGLTQGNGLVIGQWNTDGLTSAKHEQIRLLLASNKPRVDILFLEETFLKPSRSDSAYYISGYNLYRKDRLKQRKGGVLAYVSDSLRVERQENLESSDVETLWLKVYPFNSNRPILVAGVYRTPNSTAEQDKILDQNIERAYLSCNLETILAGDFNVNYLHTAEYNKHRLVKDLRSLKFIQLVTKITRPKSRTCLDHLYTTHPENIAELSVPNIGLSDHLPVFIRRKYFAKKQNVNWDSAFEYENIDDTLDTLENMLNEVLNEHLPEKEKRVKNVIQPAWINSSVLNAIKSRNSLLKKARKSNSPDDWSKYKHAKGLATNLIKKTKRIYFQETIENNKGNPKGIWKALKSLTGKEKAKTNITELKTTGGLICDKTEIAEELNDYFVNIAEHLSKDGDTSSHFYDASLLENYVASKLHGGETYEIPPMTADDVLKIINKISANKATGPDGISARIIKIIAPVFARPLCRLINQSIKTSTFPSNWKIARVSPLFKSGSRSDRNNYRPISVLSILSKIIEKHVASTFQEYLDQNNLIYTAQSAFRKGHSTTTALIKLTDQLFMNMDSDKLSGLVFIDFRKAFDVIDHEILLKKLSAYRLSPLALDWFKSYLSDRQQFVCIQKSNSSKKQVRQGVPQGTILGPILFLVFVNDLHLSCNNTGNLDMYADDVTLSTSSKDVNQLNRDLNLLMNDVSKWGDSNRMFVNKEKTKAMLVQSNRLHRKNTADVEELSITLKDSKLDNVCEHNLLGVKIDNKLSYDAHIDDLAKKLAKRIGLLRHVRSYLKQGQREIYYNTVIKPTLLYGSDIWSSCNKDNQTRIFKLQKRAARVILNAEPQARSVPLFNQLGWIPYYRDVYINRCSTVLGRLNKSSPEYMNNILIRNCDRHNRQTRFALLNLMCPKFSKVTEGGRSFSVRATKDWNALPSSTKSIQSVKLFKKTMHREILNKQRKEEKFEAM